MDGLAIRLTAMKLSSRKLNREAKLELQMTSMIDVVFLLLIFFMVTASFVQTERELNPAIKYQDRSAASASDLEPAIVEVAQSGGSFVYRVGAQELTTSEQLRELLSQFPNKADGAFVKVNDEVPFQMTAAGIEACKKAGFTAVSYVPNTSN